MTMADIRLIRELKSYTSANRLILTGTPLHVRFDDASQVLELMTRTT